jgi:quercetin dioxygenase-like cupin family protein
MTRVARRFPIFPRKSKDAVMKCNARSTVIGLLTLWLASAAMLGAPPPADAADPHHTVVPGDTVKWGPAPPSLPSGAQAAVLHGNPAKEGPFVLRLKFPAGFTVPPHRHSKDELLTVISGRFSVGAGEKLDPALTKSLPPASFVHLPAGMPHYARADSETIVQINGVGPFDVTYVDPKDDPRR